VSFLARNYLKNGGREMLKQYLKSYTEIHREWKEFHGEISSVFLRVSSVALCVTFSTDFSNPYSVQASAFSG
jgi:hypothetical protein